MKALWKMSFSCGRMGTLDGLFVAEDDEVKAAIGKHLHFGEVLGKHSDIEGTLEEKDLTRLTDDMDFVEKFEKFDCASGFNPLDYLPEEDDAESDTEEEGA